MYKSIIFDVDGTLVDTEKLLFTTLQKVVKDELNKDSELEELVSLFGLTNEIILEKLGIKDIERAVGKWRGYIKNDFHFIKLFDGIKTTLNRLYDLNIYTGIVTSRSKQEVIEDLYPLNLNKYMKTIISSDKTTKHKPDPEPILKFIEESKIDPSTAIYIGDTKYDMKCANSAGIDFALAGWGAKSVEGIDKASYMLKKPSDILDIL